MLPSALQNRIVSLAEHLQRRKAVVSALFLLCLGLASFRFFGLNLDTGLTSLFPDSSAALAQTGQLLEFNPGTRLMLVELHAEDPGKIDRLRELAANIRTAMGKNLRESPGAGLPEPADLLRLLPGLFDPELETALQAKLEPKALEKRLRELRAGLSGPLAFMPKNYLRHDPLGFIPELMRRLPADGSDQIISVETLSGADYPVSADRRRLLLVLQPEMGINDVYGAKEFMRRLNSVVADISSTEAGVKTVVAGGLRFTAENATAIERDLKLAVSLSLLLIALIYLLIVRSAAALWLFLTPVAAVIFSGSSMSLVWPAASGLALGFGAAVLGLAEDYAVLVHYALRNNPGQKPKALGLLARPLIFSAALCISSFCVLMLSSIPALRQLGFFAAVSLLSGLAVAMLVLPCLPWIDKPTAGQRKVESEQCLRLRPRLAPTLLLAGFCLMICVLGFERIGFDASFQNLGANSAQLRHELAELRSRWETGPEPEIWASSGRTLDEALENAAALSIVLRANPAPAVTGASQIFSLADLLPPWAEQRENINRWNRFVENNAESLAQNLRQASQAGGFKPEAFIGFSRGFAASGTRPEKPVTPETLKRAGFAELLWWMLIEKNGQWHVLTIGNNHGDETPRAGIPAGSVLLSSSAVTEGLNRAFEQEKFLLPLAGLLCFLLLTWCFRRPDLILLACLPPLFGLAAILAWLYLSASPLTLAGAAALILVIGLGADYGIVMLHELSAEFNLGAFKSILVSGLTTLAGLGVLLLARHPVLHTLGSVAFYGLLAEMGAVLLIVPFLCRKK